MSDEDTVARLRAHIRATIGPLIDVSRPLALVDFQDSMNSGDHAIWLGEKAFLQELGAEIAYECSEETYDPDAMRSALGKGQILLSGGGSFGDMYGRYHSLRLRVFADFPANEILVLPQTVMFFSDETARETADAIIGHGKVTIVARDVLSEHALNRMLGDKAQVRLAPDMAVMLGPLERRGRAAAGVVWISRTDRESRQGLGLEEVTGLRFRRGHVKVGPFAPRGRDISVEADAATPSLVVSDWYRAEFPLEEMRIRFGMLPFEARSRFWLDMARRLLSTGRVVVSDRLHGHILSTLMGVPHVLLNNSYGKNISYFETWSRPSDLCRLAQGPVHAWELAQELLEDVRAKPPARSA